MKKPCQPQGNVRREGVLDALRVVACLLVIAYHYAFHGKHGGYISYAWPAVEAVARYGFLGVQVFFLISGWLVLRTAQGRTLRDFAIARAVRIAPTFWIACLATTGLLLLLDFRPPSIGGFLANIAILPLTFRSLLATEHKFAFVDSVYWTLGYELRFYALVGLLVGVRRLGRIETVLWGWLALVAAGLLDWLPRWLELVCMLNYATYFIGGAFFARIRSEGLSLPRAAGGLREPWPCSPGPCGVGSVPPGSHRMRLPAPGPDRDGGRRLRALRLAFSAPGRREAMAF